MNGYEITLLVVAISAIPVLFMLGYSIHVVNILSARNRYLTIRVNRMANLIEFNEKRYRSMIIKKYGPVLSIVKNEEEKK